MSTNIPHSQDAVLGGVFPSPSNGAVLGGLNGVKQRLRHPIPARRIAALQQLCRHGSEGLVAIASALQDPVIDVQRAAYRLLQASPAKIAQSALDSYCHYPLFEQCCTLRGHAQGITAVALSPDEQTLVSSSRDRTIHVWDLQAQESYLTFTAPFFVSTLTVSPDGRLVVLRDPDHQIRAWSLRNGQELPLDTLQDWDIDGLTDSLPRLMSPTTNTINQLSQGWLDDQNQWAIPEWGKPEGQFTEQIKTCEPQESMSIATGDRPKPRAISSTTIQGDRYLISSSQARIRIWDLQKGREVAVLSGHTSLVTAIAAASSGQWIVSGSEDRTVRVWGVP